MHLAASKDFITWGWRYEDSYKPESLSSLGEVAQVLNIFDGLIGRGSQVRWYLKLLYIRIRINLLSQQPSPSMFSLLKRFDVHGVFEHEAPDVQDKVRERLRLMYNQPAPYTASIYLCISSWSNYIIT